MKCRICELIVEVPTTGGLPARCQGYYCDATVNAEIAICEEDFEAQRYGEDPSEELVAYMEAARLMYQELLRFDGLYIHASAVAKDGKAYLFSGPCGTGKSTHTRLWQHQFGEDAKVFNDDKPALRRLENRWYAYGTPWCGKDGININMKVPLAGICFLKQGEKNQIRRLTAPEALQRILTQTLRRRLSPEQMDLMLSHVDKLIREIPFFELENRPEPEAALLSYETMSRAAEEAGL